MQTATKTVTRGIYNRVPTGEYVGTVQQFKLVKIGETTTVYNMQATKDSVTINGKTYKVEYKTGYALKVLKTKLQTNNGGEGLIDLFMSDSLDCWILKVIENCKPINK